MAGWKQKLPLHSTNGSQNTKQASGFHHMNLSITESGVINRNKIGEEGFSMNKQLEFSKKMAVVAKIYRMGLLSDTEYLMVRNRLKAEYHITDNVVYKPAA